MDEDFIGILLHAQRLPWVSRLSSHLLAALLSQTALLPGKPIGGWGQTAVAAVRFQAILQPLVLLTQLFYLLP